MTLYTLFDHWFLCLLSRYTFGLSSASSLPDLIGTLEVPDLSFSSISILKDYSRDDKAYKIFSCKPMADDLLDKIFRFVFFYANLLF